MNVVTMLPGNDSRGSGHPSENLSLLLSQNHTLGSDSVVILPRNYSDLFYNEHRRLTRVPQYRNSRTGGTRSTRSQIDHDVVEGLPVRHWRKRPIHVNTAPEKENVNDTKARNLAWPELEMPRDHHLLSEMSQNLLRAARMPQAQKSIIAPLMEDDKEPAEDEDVDGNVDSGFIAKRWAVLPKELERPEPEFLAKRRKGLPSIHGGAMAALGTTQQMRKTKIRKLDTSGGSSVLEVLVPDEQVVDGEIFEDETSPIQAPAPGTVVEGVGVANAEGVIIAGDQGAATNNKRRPPPPKRKSKAPNRGRKKKVAFIGADGKPTSRETNDTSNGMIEMGGDQIVGREPGKPNQIGAAGGESMLQEDEEGSEEGSDGGEGEEGQKEEGELSTSPSPPPSPSIAPQVATGLRIESEGSPIANLNPPPDITITTSAAVEPYAETTPEIKIQPNSPPNLEITEQEVADSLPNNMTDEDAREDVDILEHNAIMQPILQGTAEPMTEAPLDHASHSTAQPEEETPLEPEPSPNVNMEDITVEVMQPIAEKPTAKASEESLPEMALQSIADPLPEHVPQDSNHSETENLPGISVEDFTVAEAEPPSTAAYEPAAGPDGDSLMESSTEAPGKPMSSTTEQPSIESVPEITIGSLQKESQSQALKAMPAPTPEPTEKIPSVVTTEVFPVPKTQVLEETATFAVEHSTPEPPLDPAPPRIAEVYYEPPVEPAERRFSFTRPTASPKAPTPSPPTPIEDKFSLRTSYVSPKAPTMSPPTPIDRSMLSSPDIPLADQQFVLPPPIDTVREGIAALGPDTQYIPNSARLSVEAAPHINPQVAAKLPVHHDPLDGLAPPEVAKDSDESRESKEQAVQFSDGEEDLLGSLERSLDQRSRT